MPSLTADFQVSNRVGDGILSTLFTDTSVGIVLHRKWLMGDGTVFDDPDVAFGYTYRSPGVYSPTLIVRNTTQQESVTKSGFIIVNEDHSSPAFVIMQSFNPTLGRYWRIFFDIQGFLIVEDQDTIRKSFDPVLHIKSWTFIEYHSGIKRLYMGSSPTYRTEIPLFITPNTAPLPVSFMGTQIAPNTTMKVDELKIWTRDFSLLNYYVATRRQAGILDGV